MSGFPSSPSESPDDLSGLPAAWQSLVSDFTFTTPWDEALNREVLARTYTPTSGTGSSVEASAPRPQPLRWAPQAAAETAGVEIKRLRAHTTATGSSAR